jgi:tRNA modification GTPase
MAIEFRELTPQGRGAVSVIGVRGEGSRACIDGLFAPNSGRGFRDLQRRSIVYGTWNSTGEDLIVVKNGSAAFEVQCHGGLAAVDAIKADLVGAGVVESANRSAWTLAETEQQSQIAQAIESCSTERTAKHLLRQYQLWHDPDWSDELAIAKALSFAKFGEKLTSPWQVVLCGRPNVGKSSLINALSGFERAIVHATAGTTRDLVSQQTAIDGWPVELIDSAGIREAENQIEKAGVAKANEVIESADLVVHVVDATDESDFDPSVSQHRAGVVVVNKADLCDRPLIPKVACPTVVISAKTGEGIDTLLSVISKALVPTIPSGSQIVPITIEQLELLKNVGSP